MVAELGPGPATDRADGNSPGDADALTRRAWLATLPGELAAQRRVMAGLADRCEAWPLVMSLLVGCSLGRGAADALSDIDAALGVDAERGQAGAEPVAAAEAMVVAALPDLGPLIDVLRHRTGTADQWARRIFAQFADGTELDLTVVAQADIEIRRRGGGAPDFIPLYQVSTPPDSQAPDAQALASGAQPGGEPPTAYAVTGDQVREWAFLGWCALIDADKYLRRGLALGSPQPAPPGTPPHLGAVGRGARRAVPMAWPVTGARPRPGQSAAGRRVHRRRPRHRRPVPRRARQHRRYSLRPARPPPDGTPPNSRRRWPPTSPACSPRPTETGQPRRPTYCDHASRARPGQSSRAS